MPLHCRCLAVAVDPDDVNVLAAIGVPMLPAVAGIPDAAGVSVVAGVLAVYGVALAMSSCKTALFGNRVLLILYKFVGGFPTLLMINGYRIGTPVQDINGLPLSGLKNNYQCPLNDLTR